MRSNAPVSQVTCWSTSTLKFHLAQVTPLVVRQTDAAFAPNRLAPSPDDHATSTKNRACDERPEQGGEEQHLNSKAFLRLSEQALQN